MSESNRRNTDPNTVHHLTSRIAHRVYFLKEEQRNDFLELVMRVTAFSGIVLMGWCIMENHFHLLVYLPEPEELSNEEVIRRYAFIRDVEGHDGTPCNFELWANQGEAGQAMIRDRVKALRKRMYSIAHYMQMIKQWFTENYNVREAHKGTMWEATYHDRVIEDLASKNTRDRLCYVHLNPVRAAITPDFAGYRWSSLYAIENGEGGQTGFARMSETGKGGLTGPARLREIALRGMRMAYGEGDAEEPRLSDGEMIAAHHARMAELLEEWKRQRAEEIARKRAAGYQIPADALTDEAMIAQAQAHLAVAQNALVALRAEREIASKASERREMLVKELRMVRTTYPEMSMSEIAALVGKPERTVYRYMKLAMAS